jgi:hypothetical protein
MRDAIKSCEIVFNPNIGLKRALDLPARTCRIDQRMYNFRILKPIPQLLLSKEGPNPVFKNEKVLF